MCKTHNADGGIMMNVVCVGPTMKLKRQVVTKMYEKEIDALYADPGVQ